MKTRLQPFNREDSLAREFEHLPQQNHPDWSRIFVTPYRTSQETKLQSFAYKLVYRLTPCYRHLHKLKIRNSEQCSFCTEVDSIPHFLITCRTVTKFWVDLAGWCLAHLDLNLTQLSESEVLLGVTRRIAGLRIINWLILCAKFFIQKHKLFHKANISLIGFLAELRSKLASEKQACFHENKPGKFRIWKDLYEVLG